MISEANTRRYRGSVPRWKWRRMNCETGLVWSVSWTIRVGMYSSDEAKMTGMTPAMLTLSGM